jgi:hypothetical protein
VFECVCFLAGACELRNHFCWESIIYDIVYAMRIIVPVLLGRSGVLGR